LRDHHEQLNRLSRISLKTEDDVREEFVTPLLQLLGYDHARGEIFRGKSLSTPYKSGTKRKEYIVPDYLTSVRDHIHLAIDAKHPGSDSAESREIALDVDYVGQVHSYAAHREVQAPFFVIVNGAITAVFDTSHTDFQPVLVVTQTEIETRFYELAALISKESLSRVLLHRLPLSWEVPIHHRNVGFQPMNIAVGDFDLDGLPEVAIALSENHVPIVSARGDVIADIETTGWVWWVTQTGATRGDEATLLALQKDSGSNGLGGKLLGIVGSSVLWEYSLPRAGSGFEHLEKMTVDPLAHNVTFGPPCDSTITCLSLSGDLRWSTQVINDSKWGSTMHVLKCEERGSVLATCGRQSDGVIAELDPSSGELLNVIELPFRGGQVLPLDGVGVRIFVGSADTPQLALLNCLSRQLVVFDIPFASRHYRMAIDSSRSLLAISGPSQIQCFQVERIHGTLPDPVWRTDVARGFINRLIWTSQGKLIASTVGRAAEPELNGLYLLRGDGELLGMHTLTTRSRVGSGDRQAGVRDVRATSLISREGTDIVAVADDSRLYVWSPT
jgi:hypothetical protein